MKTNSIVLSMGWSLLAATAAAQTPQPPAASLPTERAGIVAGQVVALRFEDALIQVLQNNQDIEASRLDLRSAELGKLLARGVYDPAFGFDAHYEKRATPVSSILGGTSNGKLDETDLMSTPSLAGFFPWGASYQASTTHERQTSSNLFSPLNPQYLNFTNFYYEQSLFRGRAIDEARRGIQVAARNRDLSEDQFRQRVLQVAAQAAKAYFDLLSAQESLKIEAEAFAQAQRALEANQRLAAQGLLSDSDIVAARTQVSTFETAYFSAQELVTRTENALKSLMLRSKDSPLWKAALDPVSNIEADSSRIHAIEIPMDTAIAEALQLRPEIAQMKTLSGINQINTRFFADQTHPQVNAYASYTAAGLAGALANRPPSPLFGNLPLVVPAQLIGGLNDAIVTSLNQRYPTFRVGVKVSLPIRNSVAEANLGLATVDARRVRNQTEQVEQAIATEVRNAAQALQSAQARLRTAMHAREFAQIEFDSERRKLQVGLTSVFELFSKQTNLVGAQGREIQARTDLRKAVIEMERSMGRTFDVYQIDIKKQAASSPAR